MIRLLIIKFNYFTLRLSFDLESIEEYRLKIKRVMQLRKKIILTIYATILTMLSACHINKVDNGVKEVIDMKVVPFSIEDVKLLDGPFKHATELDEKILLSYKPDRFLAKFRSEAGLEPKAEHYEGWESETIAGHSLGHYLTALSLMYATTGSEEYLNRVNYIIDELYECQQADGEGYIGAFPNGKKILEEEVAKGDIKAQGFNLNGIWVPFYTEHKVMDGCFHAYKYCGNQKALKINIRFADWLATVVQNLSDDKIQEMLNCEHGGINEALAELYACTGNKKYLDLSRVFQHKAIIDPIIKGEDILAGKHANTQIPKFIGLARRYELTGDQSDHDGAVNFWNMMVHHHTYVTGGNGNHEYLGQPDKLNYELSDNTTETCNVYNMLKLSEHLFEWTASPEVMDYYERALFNHILSSQHDHTGHVVYNLSLDMGGFKAYQDPEWFTCCIGTGMENHAKYSKNIFYHNDKDLYVVQFIASELNWKNKGLKVTQTTAYPEEEGTKLEFVCEKPLDLNLKIRYPQWAQRGIEIKVNGEIQSVDTNPESFVSIRREWHDGDIVEVKIPFTLHSESMPDNKSRIAIFNGPVVLAGDLGPVPDPKSDEVLYVPVLMTMDTNPENWLIPIDSETNSFRTSKVAYPRDVDLKPFYRTHDRHYTIFWDMYSTEEWEAHQQAYKEEMKQLKEMERKTIDLFRIGEMQPERDHNLKEEKSWVNEYKSKKFREADRSGWFSFDMNVANESSVDLVVEYWGGFNGSKTFDILVNDQVIATENISGKQPGKFIFESYTVPGELLKGKEKVNVKFLPHEGHRAGPVFSVRTIRKK